MTNLHFQHDFWTAMPPADFERACARLKLTPEGPPQLGFSRRSLSAGVRDQSGRQSWLKVTATCEASNFFREGEVTAPSADSLRPAILRTDDWQSGDLHFRALLTSRADSPAVETVPFAADNAARITDAWIGAFKAAVLRYRNVSTERHRAAPTAIAAHIRSWFGPEAPCVAEEFCAAHGDANWSNLTSPNLAFLDWETWGLAPRGFDLAYLLVFSCPDRTLSRRLEAAFDEELSSRTGCVALLICLGEFLNLVQLGLFPCAHREPAMQMAHRILAKH